VSYDKLKATENILSRFLYFTKNIIYIFKSNFWKD